MPDAAARYLWVQSIVAAVIGWGIVAGLVAWLVPDPWRMWILIAVGALFVLGVAVEAPWNARRTVRLTRYWVDEDVVRIRRGGIFSSEIEIPTAQILDVTISEGPLLRRWDFAEVSFRVLTRSEEISPVSKEEATALRERVLGVAPGVTDGVTPEATDGATPGATDGVSPGVSDVR